MRYFPQLSTGAMSCFPLMRSRRTRKVMNELWDGRRMVHVSGEPEVVEWELRFEGLSDEERAAVEEIFEACDGQWGTFAFLDPWSNLLKFSGDLTKEVWHRDPMVRVAGGVPDPCGGTAAFRITNTGATEAGVYQVLPVPEWFVYAWSVSMRSPGTATVVLRGLGGGGCSERRVVVGDEWGREWVRVDLGGSGEEVRFGIWLEPGGVLEVYGPQVEAQPFPSAYKQTGSVSGVYLWCRFTGDELAWVADGPGAHSGTVRIWTRVWE